MGKNNINVPKDKIAEFCRRHHIRMQGGAVQQFRCNSAAHRRGREFGRLDAAITDGNLEEVAAAAHALKSPVSNLGGRRLADQWVRPSHMYLVPWATFAATTEALMYSLTLW